VIEEEADDAEVSFVVVEIELGASGHMRCENFRIDGEVEHGEVTPVCGQKRLQHRWRVDVLSVIVTGTENIDRNFSHCGLNFSMIERDRFGPTHEG